VTGLAGHAHQFAAGQTGHALPEVAEKTGHALQMGVTVDTLRAGTIDCPNGSFSDVNAQRSQAIAAALHARNLHMSDLELGTSADRWLETR